MVGLTKHKVLEEESFYFHYSGKSCIVAKRMSRSVKKCEEKLCPLYCSCCLVAKYWLFAAPGTVALQAPLSMGFPRQEYCSGSLFPPPGESSWPRDWTRVSFIGKQILYHWATWEAPCSPNRGNSVQLHREQSITCTCRRRQLIISRRMPQTF